MDTKTLSKANKLMAEIEHTKKMISALQAPYFNSIKAISYRGDKEVTEVYIVDRNSKLYELILNYFIGILSEQEKEFNSL